MLRAGDSATAPSVSYSRPPSSASHLFRSRLAMLRGTTISTASATAPTHAIQGPEPRFDPYMSADSHSEPDERENGDDPAIGTILTQAQAQIAAGECRHHDHSQSYDREHD